MPTKKDIKRLLKKGLTGKEAALLILQDSWEVDNDRTGFLNESDIQAIKRSLSTTEDIQEYNKWVDLYRLIDYSLIDAERVYLRLRGDIHQTLPEVMSFFVADQAEKLKFQLPRIVTAQEYEDIKSSQRQSHMEELLSLWEVAEWLNEEELASPELIQEWEEYCRTAKDDDILYESLLDWLFYEKGTPELGVTYIEHFIQLLQDGKLHPVTLSVADRKKLDEALSAGRQSQKYDWGDEWKSLKKQAYNKAKSRESDPSKLVEQLELLKDGRIGVEEGEQLLRYSFCLGQEAYEAGVTSWVSHVDEFKLNYDKPFHAYAVLQQDGATQWVTKEGNFNHTRQEELFDRLSQLSLYQRVFEELDDGEPGSGLIKHLTNFYASIRVSLKHFLAFYSVIEACSEITGIRFVERMEGWYQGLESLVRLYNSYLEEANISGRERLYKGPEIKLPLLDIEGLKPDPEQLQYIRDRMAIALGPEWFRDTTLKLLDESTILTAEEVKAITEEKNKRGQNSPLKGFLEDEAHG